MIKLKDGSAAYEHRLVWIKANGEIPKGLDVHHINGNKQDNRIENLELIPHGKHTTHSNFSRQYKKGYKMNITQEERIARSERARKSRLAEKGRKAQRNKC